MHVSFKTVWRPADSLLECPSGLIPPASQGFINQQVQVDSLHHCVTWQHDILHWYTNTILHEQIKKAPEVIDNKLSIEFPVIINIYLCSEIMFAVMYRMCWCAVFKAVERWCSLLVPYMCGDIQLSFIELRTSQKI